MGTSTTQHEANSAIEKAIRSFVGVLTNAQSKVQTASLPQTTDEPPAHHQTVTSSIQREMQRLGGCFAEDLRNSSAECKVISHEISRKLQAAVPHKRQYRRPSSSRPIPNRSFLEMFRGRKNTGKPTIPDSRLVIPVGQHLELNFCLLPDCTTKSPKNEMELFQAGLGRRTLIIAVNADDEQITRALLEEYPKMKTLTEGWLLYKSAGGRGRRRLSVVARGTQGYSAKMLKKASKNGKYLLYVVPLREKIDCAPLPHDAPEFRKIPTALCESCGLIVPRQLLTSHAESCEFNCEQVHEDDQVQLSKPDVICSELQVQENVKLATPCAVASGMDDSGASSECQVVLGRQVLHQLQTRLEQACQERPLDYDSVEFICMSVMTLICSLSAHIHFPQEVLDGLMHLSTLLIAEMERGRMAIMVKSTVGECRGRPKLVVSEDHLADLIEMDLSVLCISKLLGVSLATVRRRMQELGVFKRDRYSSVTDEELDRLVLEIKQDSRDFGYRRVKGRLKDLGHRVQWARVKESMHRVDSCGVLERMASLGFVVRKTYSVPAPLSLLHVNTNHKLVRYGMVMFGGIDRFSRKILYLKAANNNKASTALGFFLEAAEKHGFPSRVCGDLEVENVDIAQRMFEVRGCGRGSFTSGKDVMNQWIERLWRDVWNAVSSVYYDVLSSLEEDRLLDPANGTALYCAQYVFLPRIQTDLDTFAEGWNNRSLRKRRESTPNKLCKTGKTQCSVSATENSEGDQLADVNISDMECSGIQVPELVCPLDNEELEKMTQVFNPSAPSSCFGADIYCAVVQYVRKVVESR
ncbi:hypothetical protein GJAV_G00002240 [Gymnothorax javanicus]|nr:hypothetical protein GJAV_G00002240 [Gymnothorax javanicus]